ncbi:GerAB/ArcD/ProY family transporter [Pseudoneobacillus sp. C159]
MKEKISLWQLFILIILSTLGSSIVVNIGVKADNNAWIAILIACLSGLFLVYLYLQLLYWFPKKNLFEILDICLGKWVGRLIGFLYITYFFLLAAYVVRDFGELMVSTIYLLTPIEFIHLTLILLVLYIVMLGIEVLGRSAEIFFPYAFVFLLFVGLGIVFSGELKLENLEPILQDGAMQVLNPALREVIHFPFGEFIVFMVIIPYTTLFKKAAKTSVLAYLVSGLLLTYSSILQISTLGVLKNRVNFPLLSAARNISLLNFIERVDLLIVFIMMLGIIVKVSILFYGGLKGLENIFHLPYRSFGFPMAMIIALFSIWIAEDFPTYTLKGIVFLSHYIQTIFHIVIPTLLVAIAFFKRRKGEVNQLESL